MTYKTSSYDCYTRDSRARQQTARLSRSEQSRARQNGAKQSRTRQTQSNQRKHSSQRRTPQKRRTHKLRRFLIALVLIALFAAASVKVFIPQAEKLYYPLKYQEEIQAAAEEYQVNPYWIIAMVKCESDFDPDVVSSAGAVGLMQIMESTAQDIANRELVDSDLYSLDNLTDPETNINYGTAYLRYLVERYHEMNPAIAAYNAGLGNVDDWLEEGGDIRDYIEFPETQSYLELVNRAKEAYERLYPDAFDWES